MKRLILWILVLHLLVAALAVAFMDHSFGAATLDRLRDGVIDGYEWLGFGNFFVGLALPAALLAGAALVVRKRSDK
jgi:hypothetical protein